MKKSDNNKAADVFFTKTHYRIKHVAEKNIYQLIERKIISNYFNNVFIVAVSHPILCTLNTFLIFGISVHLYPST